MNGCDPGDKTDTGDDDHKVAKSEGSNGGDFADKALCVGDDREVDRDIDGVKTGEVGLKALGGNDDVDDVAEPWGCAGAGGDSFGSEDGKSPSADFEAASTVSLNVRRLLLSSS